MIGFLARLLLDPDPTQELKKASHQVFDEAPQELEANSSSILNPDQSTQKAPNSLVLKSSSFLEKSYCHPLHLTALHLTPSNCSALLTDRPSVNAPTKTQCSDASSGAPAPARRESRARPAGPGEGWSCKARSESSRLLPLERHLLFILSSVLFFVLLFGGGLC